jgi:hypothetical protein
VASLPHRCGAERGGNIVVSLTLDGVAAGGSTLVAKTLDATGSNVIINPAAEKAAYVGSVGHLTYWAPFASGIDTAVIATGYNGELASTRVSRLCAENSLAVDVTAGDSEPMGPQPAGRLIDLLRQCEDATEGTLLERRNGKLGFDPLSARYNQAAAMTLLYTTQVADLAMNDDDRNLLNDATVTRTGGANIRYQITSGPLSTDLVTGAGDYPTSVTRNVATDDQARNHAYWLVSVGTVDEPRYTVYLNLRANPGLIAQWLACDVGSRILVNSPPSIHTGPAPLDLVIEGYRQTLDAVEWTVVIDTQPYRPYEVFQIENGTGNRSRIAAGDGQTTVNVQRSATDTSFAVTSASARWVDSATYPTDFPFLVECAGEVMSCTAITGTTLAQTMTMTRGVHGVSKIIPAGSGVDIWRAPAIGL